MSTPYQRLYQEGSSDPAARPWRQRLFAAVPADKFVRPSAGVAYGAWLHRPRVNEVIDRAFHRHAVVCISGNPGAGKSVAAAQFIDIQGSRGLWYRVGPEDRQAPVVLAALLYLLESALPGYRCAAAESLLECAEAAEPQSLVGAVNSLLHAAAADLADPVYLAIDDLHALDPASDGGRLLLHTLATLPPGLKCLGISRHPLAALRAHLRPERFTEIGGGALALTPEETQELCRMFLQSAVPATICREIHERTLGWVRGVVAFARALECQLMDEGEGSSADLLSGPPSAEQLALDSYFEHHVIRSLEPALRTRLCELCWLDELSPELVGSALGLEDVSGLLSRLFSLGLLIRPAGQLSGQQLQLHPLFADFLRRRARRALPGERPGTILVRAAEHLSVRGEHETAIDYLLRAGAFAQAAEMLEAHGLDLLGAGRFEAVLDRLERLPINRVADSPWLLLIQGIALLEANPVQALPPLEQALTGFTRGGDPRGEALCLAQHVSYHAGVDGAYFHIPPLLQRLEKLIAEHGETLAGFPRLLADLAIAAGRTITASGEPVEELLYDALAQAQRHHAANLEIRVRIIRCHRLLQRGELRGAMTELERMSGFMERADVGNMAKALVHAQQCHYLALADMPESFARHRHRYQQATLGDLCRQTLTAPLLCRWACEIALRRGCYEEAWMEVEGGLSLGYAAANPNQRSQFLLYRALLLAMRGERERARLALGEAERFFEQFGTGPFEAQRNLLTAAVRLYCGDTAAAGQWLKAAARAARRTGARQLRAGTHAFAARHALALGDLERARAETRALLQLMREQQLDSYFLCEPETTRQVLTLAARDGMEPETVNRLARRLLGQSLTPQGEPVPLLRLELLGRIRLRCMDQEISGDHLSRRERAYVATLAGAHDQQMDRERLFEAIWPGGDRNSANIYVVRTRLKKSLQQAAPSVEPGHYFKMTASVVRLENGWVDAAVYQSLVEAGLGHWIRGEHWQAECLFQEADALWRGTFAPMAEENDLIRDYRLQLHRLTEQRVLAWAALLEQRGACTEAEAVLEHFLQNDPINEEAVKRLYRLRRGRNAYSAAERTLAAYRRHLEAEQFGYREIERALEAIRAG